MTEEKRIYDQWAGNLKGIPEDKTRCVADAAIQSLLPGSEMTTGYD